MKKKILYKKIRKIFLPILFFVSFFVLCFSFIHANANENVLIIGDNTYEVLVVDYDETSSKSVDNDFYLLLLDRTTGYSGRYAGCAFYNSSSSSYATLYVSSFSTNSDRYLTSGSFSDADGFTWSNITDYFDGSFNPSPTTISGTGVVGFCLDGSYYLLNCSFTDGSNTVVYHHDYSDLFSSLDSIFSSRDVSFDDNRILDGFVDDTPHDVVRAFVATIDTSKCFVSPHTSYYNDLAGMPVWQDNIIDIIVGSFKELGGKVLEFLKDGFVNLFTINHVDSVSGELVIDGPSEICYVAFILMGISLLLGLCYYIVNMLRRSR